MEGAAKCIKFLVVFFNFIFFVFGCVLIGVGAWTLVQYGDYVDLSESVPYATGSKVMIAAGVLVAVISFLGCCGAWKENRCMLVIFFICLLVILALEITAGVLGYQNRGKLDDTLTEDVLKTIQSKYGEEDSKGVTDGLDKLQRDEKCCGWNSYKDWATAKIYGGVNNRVPDSCCKEEKTDCGKLKSSSDTSGIYTEGCKEPLETLLKDKLYVVGAIGVTVVVIQILGMIFALVLICKIGSEGTMA